jgi:PAS domain S-box-containing protein
MLFEESLMKQKKDWLKKRQVLRAEADQALSSLSVPNMKSNPAETMLHEILVHKFELEMQIEELQRTHAELEEARDRYAEYYESAPIGYFTLDREGRIVESNLTGATLLGIHRANLTGRRLAEFISSQDQDHWHRVQISMLEHTEMNLTELTLKMVRPGGTSFYAYIGFRRLHTPNAIQTFRVALFDISKIKQTEAQ